MQYEHLEFQESHFQTLSIQQDMQYLNENFIFFSVQLCGAVFPVQPYASVIND